MSYVCYSELLSVYIYTGRRGDILFCRSKQELAIILGVSPSIELSVLSVGTNIARYENTENAAKPVATGANR